MERAIPSTGETLPVIGLAFSNHPSCADHAALTEVVKTFASHGGRFLDMTLGNATNQQFSMRAAQALGVAPTLFWSTTAFIPGPGSGPAGVKTQIDSVLAKTGASTIDLAWVTATGPPEVLAALKEEKKAGRVRHIGVFTISVRLQAAQLEALMRNEALDFIGVDYDIGNRHVEERILPLALERKIGVVAYFPFGNNSGVSCGAQSLNLFARVGSRPLPAWAAEFDATTWSHFFTKYVLSHPAITVARVGTTKPHHMLDNLGGGVGRLPDEATRQRMAAFIDALPAVVPRDALDRYTGTYQAATGLTATFRREDDTLFVTSGGNPEVALIARSTTRFMDPHGAVFEFQLTREGPAIRVTGAMLERGTERLLLTRR